MIARLRAARPLLTALLLASCAADPPLPRAADFNGNLLVDDATFEEARAVTADDVQRLFERTPSGAPSFLARYEARGERASAAVVRVGLAAGVHPLLLVAFLEEAAGLVSATSYPRDPATVERVFGCGCPASGPCDQDGAGLGAQLACLAANLRAAFDGAAERGETASGWSVGAARRTQDGYSITPASRATCAIYEVLPVVDEGAGGAWRVWRAFQDYAPPAVAP